MVGFLGEHKHKTDRLRNTHKNKSSVAMALHASPHFLSLPSLQLHCSSFAPLPQPLPSSTNRATSNSVLGLGLSRVLAPDLKVESSRTAGLGRCASRGFSNRPVLCCEAQRGFEIRSTSSGSSGASFSSSGEVGVSTADRPSVERSGIVVAERGGRLEFSYSVLGAVSVARESGELQGGRSCVVAGLASPEAASLREEIQVTPQEFEGESGGKNQDGPSWRGEQSGDELSLREEAVSRSGSLRSGGSPVTAGKPYVKSTYLKKPNESDENERLFTFSGTVSVSPAQQSINDGQFASRETLKDHEIRGVLVEGMPGKKVEIGDQKPVVRGVNGSSCTEARNLEVEARQPRDVAISETLRVPGSHESSTDRQQGMQPPATSSKDGMRWTMLLSTEALEDAHLSRASSVTDAHVLRRKGRLKEQDGLIEFIISMHSTHSPFQVMEKVERWVREHLEDPMRSTLSRLIPTIGRFHTELPLVRALQEYDEFASLSRRRYVPPNFAEIRHVLNIAQVHAIAEKLSLLTFDADGTLYADGHHIQGDNKMIGHIIKLMQQGIHVAIVTAAGYPGNATKFEDRLAGLLAAFEDLQLSPSITELFHVMGGECNYLLRVNDQYKLEFVPDKLWKPREILEWENCEVEKLLNDAQCSLESAAARLHLPIEIIRKPRAVGAVPKEATIYEVLEEMALTVQVQLMGSKLPFCAFNGGNDVFVDVGNKSIGLGALMTYLSKRPHETLHVGDRFTVSGNDSATRSQCSILWVANPEETAFFTRQLLQDIRLARLTPYLE